MRSSQQGRSDYPNQVNNVLCFPYMFSGAHWMCKRSEINNDMLVAAANAIAKIGRDSSAELLPTGLGSAIDSMKFRKLWPTRPSKAVLRAHPMSRVPF